VRFGIAIAACALVAASSVQAETWRASSANDGARGYIDTDSIVREGERVRFWREVRWPKPRTLDDGIVFDRLAALYEADCGGNTLRTLRIRAGLGERTWSEGQADGTTETVQPGSTGYIDLRSACFGEWPGE
jgi:hypothetical protein